MHSFKLTGLVAAVAVCSFAACKSTTAEGNASPGAGSASGSGSMGADGGSMSGTGSMGGSSGSMGGSGSMGMDGGSMGADGGMGGTMGSAAGSMGSAASQAGQDMKTGAANAANDMKTGASNAATDAKASASGAAADAADAGAHAADAVSGKMNQAADSAGAAADSAKADAAAKADDSAKAATDGPTDPQIVAIAMAANKAEIDAAKYAGTHTKNAKVKAAAKSMLRDHQGVDKQAKALAKKLKVKPEENDTSKQQADAGKKNMDNLKTLKGAEFDKAYIDNEVTYHEGLGKALDDTLIPSAKNAELKALLTKIRPVVAAHLEHVKSLQSSMGSGDTTKAAE